MSNSELYGIGLAIAMVFFCFLCAVKVARDIPPLGNPREKHIAGIFFAIFISGALSVTGNVAEIAWLTTLARFGMMTFLWTLNIYIIRYWVHVFRERK